MSSAKQIEGRSSVYRVSALKLYFIAVRRTYFLEDICAEIQAGCVCKTTGYDNPRLCLDGQLNYWCSC